MLQVKELQESRKQQMDSLKACLQETAKQQMDLLRIILQGDEEEEQEEDPRLANWLQGLGISEKSQKKVSHNFGFLIN